MNHRTRLLRLLMLSAWAGLFLSSLNACSLKVAPWERGNLAKQQMALDPDALDAALSRHAYGSKEGSSGGYGVGGGGCGCN
ncbi:MAG: DUF4266 domain-containing protein [Methylococcaceae bacterium]|nr:DUF4266 domain-containing protein [Methylococcaceae bacterium]